MKRTFVVVGGLMAFAAACSGGTAAAKRAELDQRLDFVGAKAAPSPRAEPRPQAPPAVAPQAEPAPAPAAKPEELGPPAVVKEQSGGYVITIPNGALFAEGESVLLASSQPFMGKVASSLLGAKDRDMVVTGHSDSSGDQNDDIDLSRQRAEAVRTFLVAQGYPAARIRAQGIGQDRPVSNNGSAKGRAQNRRMEITVSFQRDDAL